MHDDVVMDECMWNGVSFCFHFSHFHAQACTAFRLPSVFRFLASVLL